MPQRKNVLFYIFYVSISLILYFIGGISGVGEFWITLVVYAGILYSISHIWRYFHKRPKIKFFDFFLHFLTQTSLWLSVGILFFGSFLLIQNELSPAKLPLYILSNGEKTVHFQTMSHIASEKFYTQVERNISSAKKQDFVLFFEGVRPGSRENEKAFNAALGINFNPELYKNFSKLYGVVAQDTSLFLGIENTKDFNIDLSLDEIMRLYKEKTIQTQEITVKETEIQDINMLVIERLSQLSEKQLHILQYINQALLNAIMKHEDVRNILINIVGNPDIFSVILDDRNKNLVSEIEKSSEKKIFIIYGLQHFQGVYELLKAQDPKWQIQEVHWYKVIDTPAVFAS